LYSPTSHIPNSPQRALHSLTFHLTSDQEKNSQEIETILSGGMKSGEPFRRATEEDPSPGWREQ